MDERPVISRDDTGPRLQEFLDRIFAEERFEKVLDAGCGHDLWIEFPGSVRLVGLDTSPEAFVGNGRIDEQLIGDVQTYPLPSESFDAVICWMVLEHVPDPSAALANMARSLRHGGVLVVGVPNLFSLKGIVTKLTPHWFHVWAYRHLFGFREAGRPGFAPYKTYLRGDIAPRRLERLARTFGLERVYAVSYEPGTRLPRALRPFWAAAVGAGRALTLGAWAPDASDHAAVFRKA